MYKAYNLTLFDGQLKDFVGDKSAYNLEKEKAGVQLKQLINSNYEIAAEDIKSMFFPQKTYDVFISHSHNDLVLALSLSRYLKDNFKLSAFVDSICWGNIDKIQKDLDKRNRTEDNYEYEAVKKVAQHANLILASALTEAIDKSECVFFLNTKNSVVRGDQVKEAKTYSPWIYHEVYTASIIRRIKPTRKSAYESRDNALNEAANQVFLLFHMDWI